MSRMGRIVMGVLSVAMTMVTVAAVAEENGWRAPAKERARKNPLATAEGVREGKEPYDLNCRLCHGPAGKGDGPGAMALHPKPRDLTDAAIQSQTDGELFWKIGEGRGAMPPWRQLPEHVRWSLVHYIRSIATQK